MLHRIEVGRKWTILSDNQQTKKCHPPQVLKQNLFLKWHGAVYLYQWLDTGLEDHVGVKQEGAYKGLRIAGQLGHDACEQDVDIERVLEHILQLGKQNHHEWTCREGDWWITEQKDTKQLHDPAARNVCYVLKHKAGPQTTLHNVT